MTRFHISKSGTPAECKASVNGCPLGEDSPHGEFANAPEANAWAESYHQAQAGGVFGGGLSKKSKSGPSAEELADSRAQGLAMWRDDELYEVQSDLLNGKDPDFQTEELRQLAETPGGASILARAVIKENYVSFSQSSLADRIDYGDYDTSTREGRRDLVTDVAEDAAVLVSQYYQRKVEGSELLKTASMSPAGVTFDLTKLD